MSRLSPVPLPDLATNDDLCEVEDDVARVDARLVKLDAKVALLVAQREEDRRTNRVRHYWLVGICLSALVSIWLGAAGVIS